MKRVTVILADDHAIVIEGLRRILEPEFEVVGVAGDGVALVRAVKTLRPDVAVVDISMPTLNGIEAARQARAKSPNIKIVFLSMHADVVYVSEALKAGGSAYVLKSSAGTEILSAIREALRGRTFVTPAIDRTKLEEQIRRDQSREDAQRSLSPRQRAVLKLIAEGRTSKESAGVLGISPRTVEFHRYHTMASLGLHTIAELVQYAIEHHIVLPGTGAPPSGDST
jgi:DNA-binding NarL/FixJ family response regulator